MDVIRGDNRIATLHAGDLCGELALITDEPRTATVTAAEDSELLVFYKDEFLMLYKKSDQYENIKHKILTRIKENFYQAGV